MKWLVAICDGWTNIVRSTWRAFSVFALLIVLAGFALWYRGDYDGMPFAAIAWDLGVAFVLMFVAAFVTALIFHYQVWRNSRWPGGGGKRRR